MRAGRIAIRRGGGAGPGGGGGGERVESGRAAGAERATPRTRLPTGAASSREAELQRRVKQGGKGHAGVVERHPEYVNPILEALERP